MPLQDELRDFSPLLMMAGGAAISRSRLCAFRSSPANFAHKKTLFSKRTARQPVRIDAAENKASAAA
jgi:hypothetical protein